MLKNDIINDNKGIWECLIENCVVLWYLLIMDRIWNGNGMKCLFMILKVFENVYLKIV